ncbi:MAG: type II toxin-antitoxin system RelE/ParE family toxin [Cyclobacteriaceae bacterium]|nr:type II toxin-antitoxin system RelE/ParE family toxin [Cyclobacteriaceae bacterium]
MLYQVTVPKAAKSDIRNTFLWYYEKKKELGFTFESYFTKAIASIKTNPLKTQIRFKGNRVYFLQKFPYGIHYRVKENRILIIAVFHTSQDSSEWTTR